MKPPAVTPAISPKPTPCPELRQALATIQEIAAARRTDPQGLLQILREVEALHRQICEEVLVPALPTTRHELFALLQNIEAHGGWPHIYRIRLQELLQNFHQELPL